MQAKRAPPYTGIQGPRQNAANGFCGAFSFTVVFNLSCLPLLPVIFRPVGSAFYPIRIRKRKQTRSARKIRPQRTCAKPQRKPHTQKPVLFIQFNSPPEREVKTEWKERG